MGERYWEVDAVRGIALVDMIVYHFLACMEIFHMIIEDEEFLSYFLSSSQVLPWFSGMPVRKEEQQNKRVLPLHRHKSLVPLRRCNRHYDCHLDWCGTSSA